MYVDIVENTAECRCGRFLKLKRKINMNNIDSIIGHTDSYKVTHWKQYPQGTQKVYSYFESRSGGEFGYTLFFGLQYLIKKYLINPNITNESLEYWSRFYKMHFGQDLLNYDGWKYIIEKHNGKLPIVIKSVKEGTIVPNSNVLFTVENTDEENTFWLTNYIESLLTHVWYPSAVATLSHYNKQNILKYLDETGDPSLIDFKLHCFGYRGSTSNESAALGGAGHLINFKGSDTIPAIKLISDYYNLTNDIYMGAFSLVASEHSTITSWGKDNEGKAFQNMLEQYPTGLVACVSDSYDIYHACEKLWGEDLKHQILNRDGCLIVRPDSGNPIEVLPKVFEILGKAFGYIINIKGYKVLDDHIRVIQGDGIDKNSIPFILEALKRAGWSADNIAFGSGGGLLQKVNRDTNRNAFKCSDITISGIHHDVFKMPTSDPTKASKKGRLALVNRGGNYYTIPENECNTDENLLVTVFENGKLLKEYSFDEIRGQSLK